MTAEAGFATVDAMEAGSPGTGSPGTGETRAARPEDVAEICLALPEVVFGTSWGLTPALVNAADARLPPIHGTTGYNHLSVRAACAITLDRLVS